MDKILSVIKCPQCLKILEAPVFLPCSDSMCKKHINPNEQSIKCQKCGVEHQIPKEGFPFNKGLAVIIEAEIAKLDFGKTHNQAKKSCKSVENVLNEVELTLRDPNNYTHQKISDLRNTVQLKGDALKLRIDQEMQKLFDMLDEYERQCKGLLSTNEYKNESVKINNELKTVHSNLDSWIETLNKIKLDEEKWDKIIKECEEKVKNMNITLESLKCKLLLNKFDKISNPVMYFESINIEPLLNGSKLDSLIVYSFDLFKKLDEMLKNKSLNNKKWTLLYRASRDGFGTSDFHSRCDNKSNTITLIKVENGNIFGGFIKENNETTAYNDYFYRGQTNNQYNRNSFIFSLINSENRHVIFDYNNNAIRNSGQSYGPIFGEDIVIYNNSNMNNDSYSNLGTHYSNPEFNRNHRNLAKLQTFLAGSQNFQVGEIEVFQIQ